MSKKLKFIWIDDEPKRKIEAENLAERLNVSIGFNNVNGDNLDTILKEKILNNPEPDLILIDHKLINNNGIFKVGSTAAAYIRESWPKCPIICITGVSKSDVDSHERSLYEEMYSISSISKHDKSILSIAKSFNKIKKINFTSTGDLLKLMKAPTTEYEKLIAIMPRELKDFSDKSLVINISHWIRTTLIERPGFLYDRIWAATLLGIKNDSFKKVEDLFFQAKYTGIFSDESNERWWKSKLLAILSKHAQDFGLPWEKGRNLPGIEKKDYSKCYGTNEDFPEIVAYTDDTINAKRVQMRLKNTTPHPAFEDMLFFEEIRIMKPEGE